jgi:predicted amidophosphoribosyltransferase
MTCISKYKYQMAFLERELTMAYICQLYNNTEERELITPVPFP